MFRFWNTEAKGLNVYKASWRIDPTWLSTAVGVPSSQWRSNLWLPTHLPTLGTFIFFLLWKKMNLTLIQLKILLLKKLNILNHVTVHFVTYLMTLPLIFLGPFFWVHFFGGDIKFYLYWLIMKFVYQTCFQFLIEHYEYLFQCFLVFKLWFWSFWGTKFYIFKELNFSIFPSCLYVCA